MLSTDSKLLGEFGGVETTTGGMTALHSSTTDNRDPLTVRTVEEAVTLAPYLLGFQPTESLLIIVADDGAASLPESILTTSNPLWQWMPSPHESAPWQGGVERLS